MAIPTDVVVNKLATIQGNQATGIPQYSLMASAA